MSRPAHVYVHYPTVESDLVEWLKRCCALKAWAPNAPLRAGFSGRFYCMCYPQCLISLKIVWLI